MSSCLPPTGTLWSRPIKQPQQLPNWYSKADSRRSSIAEGSVVQQKVGFGLPVAWTRVSQRAVVLLP